MILRPDAADAAFDAITPIISIRLVCLMPPPSLFSPLLCRRFLAFFMMLMLIFSMMPPADISSIATP